MKKLAFFPLALLLLAAGDPSSIVKYRQASMKAMGQHMTACSLIVKGQIASRADLAAHAEAIASTSKRMVEWFPAGTGSDKIRTDARPSIWSQPAQFKAAAAKLERESAKLAALAKKNDTKGFDAQFKVVGDSCKECHDSFRAQD
jgi:cytochrome c556